MPFTSFFFLKKGQTITMAEWFYATGSSWIPFDAETQIMLEALWAKETSAWINCRIFQGLIYVDLFEMSIIHNSFSYPIIRRAH
jgi:hypothetical protein